LVIAETEELKTMIVDARGVASEKIRVVNLGVDHALFRPMPQAASRGLFGVQADAFVLLYVGGMDTYHDLFPVLDAFTRVNVPLVELHLVGDGELRQAYEDRARNACMPVRFHGKVPHSKLAEFIAVSDLCLAPYRISAFPNQTVCFSTLKIPEYMACARPVASVPSGNIKRLIDHEISGFLFPNDPRSWIDFISALPSRRRLTAMGEAAYRRAECLTWERTAEGYLSACEPLIIQKRCFATTPTSRASLV
jgi:D-inositol-3-phosphate glycosyltransferase